MQWLHNKTHQTTTSSPILSSQIKHDLRWQQEKDISKRGSAFSCVLCITYAKIFQALWIQNVSNPVSATEADVFMEI